MKRFSVPLAASAIATSLGTAIEGAEVEVVGIASVMAPDTNCLMFATKGDLDVGSLAAVSPVVLLAKAGLPAAEGVTYIRSADPAHDFATVVTAQLVRTRQSAGISPSAFVSPGAQLGAGVCIGPGTVVGDDVVIGSGTVLLNNIVVAPGVRIGRRCLVKSGSIIGEPGFGVRTGPDGNLYHFPHVGGVVIGDDVEIGAICTVCAGTIDPTTIGDFTKLDDHIHLGHNNRVGCNVVITAHAMTGGSTIIEDSVWIGPNTTIIEGLTIGRGALVGLASTVLCDVEAGMVVVGTPARVLRPRNPNE